MANDSAPDDEPKTLEEYQNALAQLGPKVTKAEKKRVELQASYVEAQKHIQHLQHERRQLLDFMIAKAKRMEEIVLSSDDEEPFAPTGGVDVAYTKSAALPKALASESAGGAKKVPGPTLSAPPKAGKISAASKAAGAARQDAIPNTGGAYPPYNISMAPGVADDVDEIAQM